MKSLCILVFALGVCFGQYTDPHCDGKQVIVELFEWKWSDVALECERFLSKKGFCGVQVSPATEHVIVSKPPRPWWERYQPVSYNLTSRSGTEADFIMMVERCKQVGVRIYVDVVLNHMAALNSNGTGVAGSTFNSSELEFPGVPYSNEHFHPYCLLNESSTSNIRDCYVNGLTDLNQTNEYVRNTAAQFLNKLIDLGVAGFRVGAATYMWPEDIDAIQQKLKNLPEGGKPFFYFEVMEYRSNNITAQQYTGLGYVTEFRYCNTLKEGIEDFRKLNTLGLLVSDHALVFVDNHDNQRGHGSNGSVITFENSKLYQLAAALLLANDYGFARVMSSYYFGSNDNIGPPHHGDYKVKDVPVSADEESCGLDWVCEHRWRAIANMVTFRNFVNGTTKENLYITSKDIAFSRGNRGYFAMTNGHTMDAVLYTGLPAGVYCDLITDCMRNITVNDTGMAHIVINDTDLPIVAFVAAPELTTMTTTTTTTATSTTTTATTVTTEASSTALTTTSPWLRTVILIEKQTNVGEDVFLRGGLDHNVHSGCSNDAHACEVPIHHRHLSDEPHYAKYNAWSINDNFLDWNDLPENGQGTYNNVKAYGTPAVWTTNDVSHPGHTSLNT